jgi:hypothetical protein
MGVLEWLRRAFGRFIGSRVCFHVVVAALFFVPHIFDTGASPGPYHLGIPRVASGDEPHYLVFIHSIIDDGDLSLANNYERVHKGSEDAGFIFRGSALNHHTIWFVGEQRVHWFQVFNQEGEWGKDAEGHPFPLLRANIKPEFIPKVEAPWNSAGLPLLLAPFFFVVKQIGLIKWMEPIAIILSAIAVVIASIFWRILAGSLTDDRRIVNLGVALAFLGTPAWHYGRSFFSEPYLICLVTGAYAFAFARERYVLSGFLIGIPIGVVLLARREIKNAVRFTIPVAFWVAMQLIENAILYGSPLHASNEFVPGWIIYNGLQLIGHPTRGILATAPIVVLAGAGWSALVKQKRAMLAPLAACAIFYALVAYNYAWSGGYAYSARFLVPLMPLFCIGLIPLLKSNFRRFVLAAGAFSILINGLAAMQYWRAFHNHPFNYFVPNSEYRP